MKLIDIIIYISIIGSYLYAEGLKPTLANGNITNHYAVRITYTTEELRLKIVTTFEPLEVNKEEHYVVVEVDEYEHKKLLNLELNVSVDMSYTERLNNGYSVSFSSPSADLGAVSTQDSSSIANYSCYRTVEGTFSTAEEIVSQYPNLAQWIDAGDSWKKENGLGGYDMKVLKITNLSRKGSKPALFITSAIHAREYAPAELATRFAEYLVSNYGIDADATWMLDYHEVHLMLMANPDARKKAEAGEYWRKNVNDNYCASGSLKGVDLNRNFSFGWDYYAGSGEDECAQTYHGPAATSEPESEAIQRYMLNLFGDHRANNLNSPAPLSTSGVYLDLHSFSELVLWPWGFSDSTPPNNLASLGRKLAYSNDYAPKQVIGLYPTNGITVDYAYGQLGIASYTIELGTAFFQDCNTFNQTIVPNNMPSLLYALKAVRAPYTLAMGPEIKDISLSTGGETSQGSLVTLSAKADDTLYNNTLGVEPTENVIQAEYYIDTPPWIAGAQAIPMSASDRTFDSPSELITKIIDTSTLGIGKHTIFLRAKDANDHWGTVSATFLTITDNPQEIVISKSIIISPTNNEKVDGNTNITLHWEDNGATKHYVYVQAKVNGTVETVASEFISSTNTNYTFMMPSEFTDGYAYLFSYNDSKYIGESHVYFYPAQKPIAPSNLNATSITPTTATLTWRDNSNNETGFKIYSGSVLLKTVGANVQTTSLAGLNPNSTYTYTVYAYNTSGISTGTSKTFTTPQEIIISKSIIISPTNNEKVDGNTNITLHWEDNGATKHYVYIQAKVNGTVETVASEFISSTNTNYTFMMPSEFTDGYVYLFSYNGSKYIGESHVYFYPKP